MLLRRSAEPLRRGHESVAAGREIEKIEFSRSAGDCACGNSSGLVLQSELRAGHICFLHILDLAFDRSAISLSEDAARHGNNSERKKQNEKQFGFHNQLLDRWTGSW